MSTLDDIKKRAENATEGPWGSSDDGGEYRSAYVETTWSVDGENAEPITDYLKPADAEFIAHSRTDVPKLVAALEAMEAQVLLLESIQDGTDSIGANVVAGSVAENIRYVIEEALA